MGEVRYISYLLLFINTLLFTTCSTAVQEVDDVDLRPFIKVGSKYYLVTQHIEMDWFEAAHFCRSYDSDLLTIESLAEKNALFSYLKTVAVGMYAWTSGNDLSAEGTYMSLNSGRRMLYAFWEKNQPDNANDAEDCIEVIINSHSFTMNDDNCSAKRNFICEKRLPLNARNAITKAELNCGKVTESCALKKLVEVYKQTANIFNCRE
ncbi:C-type lectin 37Db-like [Bactrocera oleae]|uniref:C-type lectin 37Db-like n=1 Tax=Bactrocera oleae TaxID=104688 RepID=UPI00387EB915